MKQIGRNVTRKWQWNNFANCRKKLIKPANKLFFSKTTPTNSFPSLFRDFYQIKILNFSHHLTHFMSLASFYNSWKTSFFRSLKLRKRKFLKYTTFVIYFANQVTDSWLSLDLWGSEYIIEKIEHLLATLDLREHPRLLGLRNITAILFPMFKFSLESSCTPLVKRRVVPSLHLQNLTRACSVWASTSTETCVTKLPKILREERKNKKN